MPPGHVQDPGGTDTRVGSSRDGGGGVSGGPPGRERAEGGGAAVRSHASRVLGAAVGAAGRGAESDALAIKDGVVLEGAMTVGRGVASDGWRGAVLDTTDGGEAADEEGLGSGMRLTGGE